MDTQTTGSAPASGDSGQPDYQAKYNGLNAVLQRKTNEWSEREAAWETERADLMAKAAKVSEYEAREAAEREEAEALASYEALRERFEQDPPAPQNPNETNRIGARAWDDERYARKDQPERKADSGWPV